MFNLNRFLFSFKCAFEGLSHIFSREQNFRIQLVIAVIVVFFAFWFKIRLVEWALLAIAIGFVLVLETINTAFERLFDFLEPKIHPKVRILKDLMAAAVLIASLTALIVGILVFLPYVL